MRRSLEIVLVGFFLCSIFTTTSCKEKSAPPEQSNPEDHRQADEDQRPIVPEVEPEPKIVPEVPLVPPVVEDPIALPLPLPLPPYALPVHTGGGGGSGKRDKDTQARCGNGIREGIEQCDEGENNSNTEADACRTNCLEAFCGDGVIDTGEQCDDDDNMSGDGCSSTCQIEEGFICIGEPSVCQDCGNGIVEGTEECDDGLANSDSFPDACRTNCVEAACGDDVIDTGEQCDDDNTTSGDGCSTTCQIEALRAFITSNTYADDLVSAANALTPPNSLIADYNCSANSYLAGPYFDDIGTSGVNAADCLCRERAASQGNELRCANGTFSCWKAWIADSNPASAPASRFNMAQANATTSISPVDVTGAPNSIFPIAVGGWVDLIACAEGLPDPETTNCLDDPNIDTLAWFNEAGVRDPAPAEGLVPTNVQSNGVQTSATVHCSNWSSTAGSGYFGIADAINFDWTADLADLSAGCTGAAINPLYCFEDLPVSP